MSLPTKDDQLTVLNAAARPAVDGMILWKGTMQPFLAYRQTSSVKAYTMEDGEEKRAEKDDIILRTAAEIFDRIGEGDGPADANVEFVLTVSFIEIYMKQVRDLLDTQGAWKLQISGMRVCGKYARVLHHFHGDEYAQVTEPQRACDYIVTATHPN
ncbi:hypothetical protein ABG067_005471 [Albugo candida]